MKCDGCRACCSALGVVELGKKPWTTCDHECAIGCNSYETRPKTCAEFECAYINEDFAKVLNLTEKDRPDKTGLIIQGIDHKAIGPFLLIHLTSENAALTYWGDKLLKRLVKKHLIVLVYKDFNRKIIGPPLRIQMARRWMSQVEKDIAEGKLASPALTEALEKDVPPTPDLKVEVSNG